MSVYEKGLRFVNSKPGIILGFLLASITMAIGIFCLIRTMEMKRNLAILASIVTIAVGAFGLVTNMNRTKKLRLRH